MAAVTSQPPILQKPFTCPVCKSMVTNTRACPVCKEELSGMWLVHHLAPSHYNQGLRLAREGKIQQAIEQLQTALAIDATHINSLVVLGKLHAQQTRYEQAISYWQRALEVDPDHIKAQAGIRKAQALQQATPFPRIFSPTLLLIPVMLLLTLLASYKFIYPSTPDIAPVVKTTLQNDQELSQLNLTVEQNDSVIFLSGSLPTSDLKTRAETLAKEVEGVAAVDSSAVVISPPALAEAVQQALLDEAQLAEATIVVQQVNHDIHLSGNVNRAELRALAEEIASGVANVGLIDSRQLLVDLPPLYEAVRQALLTDTLTANLAVNVQQIENGVQLEGSVPNLESKMALESVVRSVAGVKLVDSSRVEVEWWPNEYFEYTVQEGDTLLSIARRFYGDESKSSLIYETNREQILDPDLIHVGSRLVIPINSE